MSAHKEHHGHYRKQAGRDHSEKLRHHMAAGGDVAEDKAMIKKAIGEHDEQLHGGKKTHLKLKTGGRVEGEEKHSRLDRASGGRTKHKGGHKTVVNVVMPQGGGQDHPVPVPVPVGGPPPGMAPHPAMAGPPPGAMPPGGPPPGMGGPPGMPPRPPMGPPIAAGVPMGRKSGGRVFQSDDAGSGGGRARLEKIKGYGEKAKSDLEDESFTEDGENRKMARGGHR